MNTEERWWTKERRKSRLGEGEIYKHNKNADNRMQRDAERSAGQEWGVRGSVVCV